MTHIVTAIAVPLSATNVDFFTIDVVIKQPSNEGRTFKTETRFIGRKNGNWNVNDLAQRILDHIIAIKANVEPTMGNPQGWRVPYTAPDTGVIVFEVDFDTVEPLRLV